MRLGGLLVLGRGRRSPGSTGRGLVHDALRAAPPSSHSLIVRLLDLGSVRRLATIAQAQQRPVGVLAVLAHGLDKGQVLVRPLDMTPYTTARSLCTSAERGWRCTR